MRKLVSIVLSIILITSQCLALAHATDHLLDQDRSHCAICALREHQDDHAIIITIPAVVSDKPAIITCNIQYRYSSVPCITRSIRAPPLSS